MDWTAHQNTLIHGIDGKVVGGWWKKLSGLDKPDAGSGVEDGGNDTPSAPTGNDSGGDGTITPPGGGSDFAHQLLTLTNEFRAEHEVAPLQWDDKLALAAQQHTQDMASKDYFSHTETDGDTLANRLDEVGYHYSSAGENIAMGQTAPETVMAAWENSPGHRANLLNPHFTEFGAGYVDTTQDLWTQVFASDSVWA